MPFIIESDTLPLLSSPIKDAAAVRREEHHAADVVIVGAGILGSAIASALARQGRSVILLEKSLKQPDRIVGELLQPGGVQALEELGLRDCLEEIDAIPVYGYEVSYHNSPVHIPYPVNGAKDGKRPEGRSFHHGRFVQKLRMAAMQEKNVMVVETKATELIRNQYTGQVLGVKCITKEEPDYYFGALTIVSDGYGSGFRKEFSSVAPVVKSKFYGLELIDAKLPRPGHGHVILSKNAPVLLYQIGTRETRILVDIPEGTPSASHANGGAKGHLAKVVLPTLPEGARESFSDALENGKLRSMPNSWLPPTTNRTPGVTLLGDALNMRHPLTGGGMTAALNDVVLIRRLLSPATVPDLTDTKSVLKQLKRFHWQRKSLTSVINILAQALYSLFAANGEFISMRLDFTDYRVDYQLQALQLGCFRYFQLGGNCVDGPVGLLAGIIRRPFVLFYHFFAVALYGMWIFAAQSPLWKLPMTLVECAMIFWKACVVIFPFIFSELKS